MHYITLKGHHKVIYAYHFGLLNHFRLKGEEVVNFPFFIYHSLEVSINRCKGKPNTIPLHQSIINLFYDLAMSTQHQRILGRHLGIDAKRTSHGFKEGKNKVVKRDVEEKGGQEEELEPLEEMKDEEIIDLFLEIREKQGIKHNRMQPSDLKVEVVEKDKGGMGRKTRSQKALMVEEDRKKIETKKGKRVNLVIVMDATILDNQSLPIITKEEIQALIEATIKKGVEEGEESNDRGPKTS